ncbi:hypothetical protein L7F22_048197 [Adiantum nelumboides]|nr:hypothetical protein [Adiantum nelumboides]
MKTRQAKDVPSEYEESKEGTHNSDSYESSAYEPTSERASSADNKSNDEINSIARHSGEYAVVTHRWQKFTDFTLSKHALGILSEYADEFLVHGVDVEGKRLGVDEELVSLLGQWSCIPVTYAGGVSQLADLDLIRAAGRGVVNVTVGSALDIFGGELPYKEVVQWHKQQKSNQTKT